MKYVSLLIACISLLLPSAVFADEAIRNFEVNVSFPQAPSRLLQFTEQINYDFGTEEKHGIYRYIPVNYVRDGASYRLRAQVESVTRTDQGETRDEPFETSTQNGDLNIKIGRSDQLVTGTQEYGIAYASDRAINFFQNQDELYWNVTGNGWDVPIEASTFTLHLPSMWDASRVKALCFTGMSGSTEQECTISRPDAWTMKISTSRVLLPSEGLTVVLGFPKGWIAAPTGWERVRMFVSDNGVLFFPLGALIVMLAVWWIKGRDPRRGTIIPQYEPPEGMTPALMSLIEETGTISSKAVTATIIDLARRGCVKIKFGEEKQKFFGITNRTYAFSTPDEIKEELTPYESAIFSGLRGDGKEQTMEDLKKNEFYHDVSRFKTELQKALDNGKWFDSNPASVQGAFIAVGIVLAIALSALLSSVPLGIFSGILTGAIIALFGWFMPRQTKQGRAVHDHIDGFKWFLSVTEKDRLDFHNAPERTPEQFEALLPFAIALGVEKKWAKQFEGLTIPPPQWATGVANFSSVHFVSSLNSMHTAAMVTAYSSPSSAGGGGSGFSGGGSGGGFGGGGGGSW